MSMLSFKSFLVEEDKKGSLHVFDIDDTLFHTTAKIGVKNKKGETVQRLSNAEYNDHKLPSGHTYDYSEFKDSEKFSKESKPIHPMLAKMKSIHKNITNKPGSNSKVIMNTARADFDDKEKFLDTFRKHGVQVDGIHVHRVGNMQGEESPADKKTVVIQKYLHTHPIGSVHMYDDSTTNLKSFLNMKKEHPHINFHAWHAQPDGSIKKYKE